MKKILLLTILCIATIQLVNAQTYVIEVMGDGVLDDSSPEITYDPAGVVKVEVEAIYFHFDPQLSQPDPVYFNGQEVSYSNVDVHSSAGAATNDYNKGYYRANLNTLPGDGKVILDKNGHGNDVVSFYVYVYRNRDGLPYSMVNPESEIAFLHATYPPDSVEAKFALEPAALGRDLTVTVPISDNEHIEADDRIGVLKLKDNNGIVLDEITFALNTGLDNFYLQKLVVNDVAPDVNEAVVQIYSPSPTGYGDSFYAGTILLDVEEEVMVGCTYTQGYWKTHSEMGPAPYDDTWALLTDGADTDFFISGMSWYDVFWTPVRGDVYYQLAHQYMAAYLNMLSGASVPEDVQDAMDTAEDLFDEPGEISKEYVYLAELLDDYNNGIIGPGHCDDEEIEVEWEEDEQANAAQQTENKGKAKGKNKSAQIDQNSLEFSGLTVYPNPVSSSATISFVPVFDGHASIDMYNSLGQRVSRLFDRNVSHSVPENIQFNSSSYNEGFYILRFQNGSSIATSRIQIMK